MPNIHPCETCLVCDPGVTLDHQSHTDDTHILRWCLLRLYLGDAFYTCPSVLTTDSPGAHPIEHIFYTNNGNSVIHMIWLTILDII